MQIKLVASAVDATVLGQQFAASYLVDGCLSIDAGSIGFLSSVDEQRRIQHVFLSHSHMDHIASLPMFLDNVYQPGPGFVSIYGHPAALNSLRTDIFNERVWPDLFRIAREEAPFMKFFELESEKTVTVGGLQVTPIDLEHVVPTLGFLVDDGTSSVAFVSDTSPTDIVWQALNQAPRLKAVFLECAFPNRMQWLADKAKHLTPALFAEEHRKLTRDVPIVAIHIKPAFRAEILPELAALKMPRLVIGEPNTVYEF